MATKQNGNVYQQSKTDSIFGIVEIKDKKRIVMGANVVSSKEFDTAEEAEKYIKTKPYELIINSAVVALKFYKENEKNNPSN